MTDLSGIFGKSFPEQVTAWRLRLQELRPTYTWTDVPPEFHDRGFMVSGATKAELLADIAAAIDKAETRGTSLEEFRRDFRETVARNGWPGKAGLGTKAGEAWRTRVIYRTNMSTTYHAGRRAQLIEGNFPIWVYRHGGAREPRLHHLALDGIALPREHRFWLTHFTPNGWGCTCYTVGARTAAGVRRVGGDPDKPLPPGWDAIDPRTGAPRGIDKGWAYAPGARNDELMGNLKARAAALPAPIGDDLSRFLEDLQSSGRRAAIPPDWHGRLRYGSMSVSSDLDEIGRMAIDTGLTLRVGTSGLGGPGFHDLVRAAAEASQRFGLPPLRYFGSAADYPFQPPMPDEMPPALYDVRRRSIGFPAASTDRSAVAAMFDPAGLPGLAEEWGRRKAASAGEVAARLRGMGFPGWAVVRDVGDLAVHEVGHHAHYHRRAEIDRLIAEHRMLEEGWPHVLSLYAATDAYEFFAESFTLYLRRDQAQRFRLNPALLEFLRKWDQAR